MAGFWATVLDPQVWGTGFGGTALGLVAGHFKSNRGRIGLLEKEVEECRKRDADFQVLGAGFRMIVGEVMRENPGSPALQLCGDLLQRKFGPAPSIAEFADLLGSVDAAVPDYVPPPPGTRPWGKKGGSNV